MITLQTHYGPLFRMLHSCMTQVVTQTLEEMELTSAQGHIMGYLAHQKQPPCAKDIEEAFGISHPTVSGLLSRLEKKGFIEFRPDTQDRRCKRIYVLEKGKKCNETIYQLLMDTERQVVEGFAPEEQMQFAALLKRALTNLGASPQNLHPKEENKT